MTDDRTLFRPLKSIKIEINVLNSVDLSNGNISNSSIVPKSEISEVTEGHAEDEVEPVKQRSSSNDPNVSGYLK